MDNQFCWKEYTKIKLPNNQTYKIFDNISWNKYSEIVRNTDLGLSLMLTPHTSYPPLDIASCGGVVITINGV